MLKISELVKSAYETAVGRGFHDNPTEFGTLLALIHTEVTEVLEAKTSQEISEELADILIRIFDLSGYFQIPLDEVFQKKYGNSEIEWIQKQIYHERPYTVVLKKEEFCLHTHTLLTRTMEDYRLNTSDIRKKEMLAARFHDVMIHVLDANKKSEIDILSALFTKMEKNKKRPHKHGKIV